MGTHAVCTKHPYDPDHRRFTTTAHVVQSWVVDESGAFLEEVGTDEVTHPPSPDSLWTCRTCGAPAKHVEGAPTHSA